MVGLASVMGGCQDDDGDSSGDDGPFLTAEDLGPGAKLKTVSDTAALSTLKAESFVYDNKPGETSKSTLRALLTAEGDDEKCIQNLLDGIVSGGDGGKLIFRGRIDATPCMDSTENQGLTFASSMGLYLQFTCDSSDLSGYVGKTFGELNASTSDILEDVACNTTTFFVNVQTDFSATGKFTEEGKTQEINYKAVTYSYVGDGAGNPCTQTTSGEEVAYSDGCLSIDKDMTVFDQTDGKPSEDEGTESYERYETAGIKGAAKGDATYFTSGKIKAQINTWIGELTYSAGDTPPLYSLNNGTKLLEGALGVSGDGSVRFGEEKTMLVGSCGKFQLELRSGSTLVPAKSDVEVALTSSDGKLFSDAECKIAATTLTIAKATSSAVFYAQPKDDETTSFMIQAEVKTKGFGSSATTYIELAGIDDGFLQFVDVDSVKPGECKLITIEHYDQKPATADIAVALSSDDADLFSDATCATAITALTFKKDATAATFYLKPHADVAFSIFVKAEPAKPTPAMSGLSIDFDKEELTLTGPSVITKDVCSAQFTLTHGYESGAAAVTADLVVALSSVTLTYYSDAACTAVVTQTTIANGQDHADFYVKSAMAGSSVLSADPAGDALATVLETITVDM